MSDFYIAGIAGAGLAARSKLQAHLGERDDIPALGMFSDAIRYCYYEAGALRERWRSAKRKLDLAVKSADELNEHLLALYDERRAAKDYATADKLRGALKAAGYIVSTDRAGASSVEREYRT